MKIKENSAILEFFSTLCEKLINALYESRIRKLFIGILGFLRKKVLQHAKKSVLVRWSKSFFSMFKLKDVGVFIILVLYLNTVMMKVLGKEIDIYSLTGRAILFGLGISIMFKKANR